MFDTTLQEEKAADEKLTQIGESIVNAAAGKGEVEEDEEEEDEEEAESKKDEAELEQSFKGKKPAKK